jgi:putative peptidoglycan lipid II flippase
LEFKETIERFRKMGKRLMETLSGTSQSRKLAGAAAIVMSSIVVSRITGFIREMLIPNAFGLKETADAYAFAFKITGLMYDMLVGGAIAAALIPVLTGYIEKNNEEDGWKAVGTFINIVFIVMCIISLLGIIFAPFIVPTIAPGFDQPTMQLTVRLIRILFPSVAFLMLAGLCNGILNSYQRFAAAAYGPTIYNIGSILSILFFSKYGIEYVAAGVMCSSAVYFLFQLSFTLKNLKFYRFKLFFAHPGFKKLYRLAIPSLISSSIVQVNVIISSSFASLFTAGSVAAFNIADRLWQLPYGIFAQGMGIAMLPTLSGKYAVAKMDEYKDILNKSLRAVLILSVPSAFGFVVLREQIIRTILKFSALINESDVYLTGNILIFFSIALITHSIVAIMNRGFYAINDTKTPLFIGSATIALNIALSYIFYKTTSLSTGGMALAYSLASLTNALFLMFILNLKVKGIGLKNFAVFFLKILFASGVMACAVYALNLIIGTNLNSKFAQIVSLSAEIIIGVVLYFGVIILLKVEDGIKICKMVADKAKMLRRNFIKKCNKIT